MHKFSEEFAGFYDWFISQFGRKPSGKSIYDLRKDVEAAQLELARATEILKRTEIWEAIHDAALKSHWASTPPPPTTRQDSGIQRQNFDLQEHGPMC